MIERFYLLLERFVIAVERIANAAQGEKGVADAEAPAPVAPKKEKKRAAKKKAETPAPPEVPPAPEEETEQNEEQSDEITYTKEEVQDKMAGLRAHLAARGEFDIQSNKEDKATLLNAIYSFVRKHKAQKLGDLDPQFYGTVIRDIDEFVKELPEGNEEIRDITLKLAEGAA